MEILILTSEPPYPPVNGVRMKTYSLIRGLYERGHKIRLISFTKESIEFYSDISNEIVECCSSIVFCPCMDDAKQLIKNVIGSLHKKDVILFRFKSQKFREMLVNTVKNSNIDLVHFDLIGLTQYIKFINGLAPSVASINDSYSLWLWERLLWKPYPTLSSLLEKMYYAVTFPLGVIYEKSIYENFEKVHVVSRIDAEYLKNLNSRIDVEVIPNGVNTNYFKPLGLLPEQNSLVFVARMAGKHAYNALWFIRKVFKKIKERVPDVKLYLVGKDPHSMLISEARRTKDIIVTGYVADVRPFIDKATLIVDPTRSRCGILNHVLQSMSMAKTVIGTRFSFLAIEGVKNWDNVVVAGNESDFVSKIIYLLENENERKRIGRNARKLIESEYTWEKIIPKYEEMYREAIEKFRGYR